MSTHNNRGSGILLHITSLPSAFGIGDLGEGAYEFADFLERAKQNFWQVLPLNPTNCINGNSPYSSISAFAANTNLISPEPMAKEGFLTKEDFRDLPQFSSQRVEYEQVIAYKTELFQRAYKRFKQFNDESEFGSFCAEHAYWLEDFALFVVLKKYFQGKVWSEWPQPIRDRDVKSLKEITGRLYEEIEQEKFLQYLFFRQWQELKNYCKQKSIQIVGDVPIYVTYDSVDAWTNPSIFKLDKEKRLVSVAGVPPDYFSKTGQLWGNPVYNWKVLKDEGYSWWLKRVEHNLKLFDYVRLDHFRGFVGYWEVPAEEKTAVNGSWQKAPAKDFFENLLKTFPELKIIAEDLGIITDDVKEVMNHFAFPGMKILIFAFGEDLPTHPYLPYNYIHNCVVYTGTHDNNTVKGWFEKEARKEDKKRLFDYLGREVPTDELHWEFIRLAMQSVANQAIFPMQDILGLDHHARMNFPGTVGGNWQWRLLSEQLTSQLSAKLADMTRRYGRLLASADVRKI